MATSRDADITLKLEAEVDPKCTLVAPVKPLPLIDTAEPPPWCLKVTKSPLLQEHRK